MADKTTTICAIATPPGRGGIGIIRISGPEARRIAKEISGRDPVPRQAVYCSFKDQDNNIIDNGILLFFNTPASYTGEDVIELQGHGGQVVLNMLRNHVISLGAVHARPGEFTERAFLNHKLDLVQAEAVVDLIDSVSEQAARCANRSLLGEFSARIADLLGALIDLRVYVEGALDFPEDELDFIEDNDVRVRAGACLQTVDNILIRARHGKILNEGVQAVIIGRPNVGKSSLLNRLSGTDRAIVTEIPGTTRDIIEDRILIKGISVTVADTAGIRETEDRIEIEGINRAIAEAENADIVLIVMEYDGDARDLAYLMLKLKRSVKILVIKNKIDLSHDMPKITTDANGIPHIHLSAKTGAGLDMLEDLILKSVIQESSEENAILARERHLTALHQAQQHLRSGIAALDQGRSPELLAAELQQAQNSLAQITGEFVADDLLGEIFSRFCIGK
ncbi:MAG: tRNA uridine-5-carboxymethylaminomethyl(34) synthesis GTPase MnmE [Gammaproteobacteria bacterium RIFCSPLOWO2_12_FULL_52_10]|nr:MAG: tRNA uridine-5-carboxymethylaminomethyl(34) synthesis GTPase MnmE [Gammaproteobacteria bacterium RIFCSPLOWO2_12_FULL_52_10]